MPLGSAAGGSGGRGGRLPPVVGPTGPGGPRRGGLAVGLADDQLELGALLHGTDVHAEALVETLDLRLGLLVGGRGGAEALVGTLLAHLGAVGGEVPRVRLLVGAAGLVVPAEPAGVLLAAGHARGTLHSDGLVLGHDDLPSLARL